MRIAILFALLTACKPGGVSGTQEMCAQAGTMFEKCENFGSANPLERDLMVDRWRGLCRAVFTGETKQLMSNTLEVYQALDEAEREGLKLEAECSAKAKTCDAYAACQK